MNDKKGQVSEFKLIWNDNAYRLPVPLPILMLYIGYDDKGNLVGLKRVKEDVENLPNSIRSKLGLLVSISVSTLSFSISGAVILFVTARSSVTTRLITNSDTEGTSTSLAENFFMPFSLLSFP